jgi:WD40 repeat protein
MNTRPAIRSEKMTGLLASFFVLERGQRAQLAVWTGRTWILLLLVAFVVGNVAGQRRVALAKPEVPRLVAPRSAVAIDVASFSADGSLLATGGFGQPTQIWEVRNGLLLREFPTEGNSEGINGDSYTAIAFSPDKSSIAIAFQGTVKIYSILTGGLIRKMHRSDPTGTHDTKCLEFSSDTRHLYLDSYQYQEGAALASFRSVADLVTGLITSPQRSGTSKEGDCFDASSAESKLKLLGGEFDGMKTGSYTLQVIAVTHDTSLAALGQLKNDAKHSEGFDAVRLVRPTDGREISRLQTYFTDIPTTILWRAAIDDRKIDLKTRLEEAIDQWPFLWGQRADRYILDLEKRNNRYIGILKETERPGSVEYPSGTQAAAAEPDYLAVSDDGKFAVRKTGEKEDGLDLVSLVGGATRPILRAAQESPTSAVFSDDNARLAVAMQGDDETYHIYLWDLGVPAPIPLATPKYLAIESMAFSADGATLAASFCGISSEAQQEIWLYDVRSGKPKRQLIGHRIYAFEIVFSPKGRYVATNSVDHTARVWNADTGKESFRINDPGEHIQFSSDGTYIFSDTVLYRVADGSEMCRFVVLGNGNYAVVTPDGRFDVNNFEDLKTLHWVMRDDPFRAVPLEIFMRVYFEPNLLSRLLKCGAADHAGAAPDRCKTEFRPLPPLGQLDRVQPLAGPPRPDDH